MDNLCTEQDVRISDFLETGLELKSHLASYLQLSVDEISQRLARGTQNLATLHPLSFSDDQVTSFYEEEVGTGHLFDLAAWHLNSSDYIADTLRLETMFACGHVLDFGGGIGTHALVAASNSQVDHVWFVDLNPHNRAFVEKRAELLDLQKKISVHRDLQSTKRDKFDTIVCLDVLEHLPDPSGQLMEFLSLMEPEAKALLNWYFFKGHNGEYPFHFDDPSLIEEFFITLQKNFIEVFHHLLITTRVYKPNMNF